MPPAEELNQLIIGLSDAVGTAHTALNNSVGIATDKAAASAAATITATEQADIATAAALLARQEIAVNLGNVTGSVALDLSAGTVFKATAIGPCEWSIINAPPGVSSCTLVLNNGGQFAQTAPGFETQYKLPVDFTYAGKDWVEFATDSSWVSGVWGVSWKDVG